LSCYGSLVILMEALIFLLVCLNVDFIS